MVPFHLISRPLCFVFQNVAFLALVVHGVNSQSLSYSELGPCFGGVCSVAALRNREANKRQMLLRGSYLPDLRAFFLALLDHVSRAHGIAICPSSVIRPSVSQLSLNLMHGFLSNFSCGFPWAICSDVFLMFEKKFFFDFLTIIFRFR